MNLIFRLEKPIESVAEIAGLWKHQSK